MIQIQDLRKSFNGAEVLRGVDFEIPDGETVVTPEPSSILLLGAGLLGMLGLAAYQFERSKSPHPSRA